jgi:hypothetical protein
MFPAVYVLHVDVFVVCFEYSVCLVTLQGQPVRVIGSHGFGPGNLILPRAITATASGALLVAEAYREQTRIQVFDAATGAYELIFSLLHS